MSSVVRYLLISFVLVNSFKDCLIKCEINVGYSHAINDCFHLCFGISSCIRDCEHGHSRRSQSSNRYDLDNDKHSVINFGSDALNNEQSEQGSSNGKQRRLDLDRLPTLQSGFRRITQPDHCGLRYRMDRDPSNYGSGGEGMGRIVGGEDAEPNEFPWLVSLQFTKKGLPDKHFCGASIINEYYILTAAHCLDNIRGMERHVIIKAGVNSPEEDNQLVRPDKFIIHEGWNVEQQTNDISLIRLRKPLRYVTNNRGQYIVNCICLPTDTSEPRGLAQLAGWGQLDENDKEPAEWLQKITLPLWDRQRCKVEYRNYMAIRRTHICAGGRGGEDSCMGDSGGPLTQTRKQRSTQLGLVSFGIPCAIKNLPGIYTFLVYYMDWIQNNMI